MSALRKLCMVCIFVLFLVANVAYLHRVPGLLGDEASEGENVYELLHESWPVVRGERSYIGPVIDYVRVPFFLIFGYSVLSLRIPMILFSIATFFLASSVLRRLFGDIAGTYALVAMVFSPVYLLEQRLGWAITLIPFFTFLMLWLLTSKFRSKWLWAGLVAGLGLANHILFLPTLAGVGAGAALYAISWRSENYSRYREFIKETLISLVGFWAGFGMQFVILMLFPEDQGNPSFVALSFWERLYDLIDAFPLFISGSSYVARYTGFGFSPLVTTGISWTFLVLIGAGIILLRKHIALWSFTLGFLIQVSVLLIMIDRYTLRYFAMSSLIVWILAGLGLGAFMESIIRRRGGNTIIPLTASGLSLVLITWTFFSTLLPFLAKGGSTSDFSLGNRTDSAAAFVDTRSLVACVRGVGPVYSENIHIWNRIKFFSHEVHDIQILNEEDAHRASWRIEYQTGDVRGGDVCEHLKHFRIRKMANEKITHLLD